MEATIHGASRLASDVLQRRSTIRIGVTGLARAGKTALLTSLAANLLALSAGRPSLPAVSDRLRGRRPQITIAPAAASGIPRFEVASHVAALAADPPRWPARTTSVSLLALDIDVPREGLLAPLASQRRRLEFLDYPGEWLLDLPLLGQSFADWSEKTLRRLETLNHSEMTRAFLGFVRGLPLGVQADEALTLTGHRLYTEVLRRMRDEAGLAFLQPGRFLMPPPGAPPPVDGVLSAAWTQPAREPHAGPLQRVCGCCQARPDVAYVWRPRWACGLGRPAFGVAPGTGCLFRRTIGTRRRSRRLALGQLVDRLVGGIRSIAAAATGNQARGVCGHQG